jgi:O-antigen/teichoic acid export membrane protein
LDIPPSILYDVQWLFGLVFFGMIINIQLCVFGVSTYARNRMDLSSLRNAESNILRVLLLVALFYFFRPSVSYIGIANVVASAFVLFSNFRYTKTLLPEITFSRKYFRKEAVKELLGAGVWNSLVQLSIVLMSSIDILIANIFLGVALSSELAIVKTVPIFINTIIITLVSVFAPEFTILFAQNKSDELIASIRRSLKFMSTLMMIPIGFLLAMGDEFFALWVPGQNTSLLYTLSNLTLIPLIVSTSIETLFHVFGVTNKLKTPSLVFVSSGIINTLIVISLLKFTTIGLFAIPIVGMISAVLQHVIFTPTYASKLLQVKWHTFHFAIIRGAINCGIMILVAFALKSLIYHRSWESFIFLGFLSAVITLFINLLIFFSKQDRITFLQKLKIIKR